MNKKKSLLPRKKNSEAPKKHKKSKQPQSLVEFFAQSPLAKAKVDLERIPDYGRKIKI